MPRLFVGRTRELAALEEALAMADRAVLTQATTGMGGVGKSRLAEHYMSAHADEYDLGRLDPRRIWRRRRPGQSRRRRRRAGGRALAGGAARPRPRAPPPR